LLVAAQRLQRNLVLAEVHVVEDVQEKKEMNGYTVATFSKTELNLCASMITAAKEDFIALQKKTTGPLQSSSKTGDRFRGDAATLGDPGDGKSTKTDCSVVDVISSTSSPVNSIVSPMSLMSSLSPRLEMETLHSARSVLVGTFEKREKKDVYLMLL